MPYNNRLNRFQILLANSADLAFFPISADLQYLTGIPRDNPNYGAVLHPGAWLEGAWMTPAGNPILTLPRMTVEFGGVKQGEGADLRVLGDWDDPNTLMKDIIAGFGLGQKPRIAISDSTKGETVSTLHHLFPDAIFSSATDILRQLRVIKDEDEIAIMQQAGEITEAAFTDVVSSLKHGMTELDIVSEVDYQLRRHGALGPSFVTSLYNSGPNHPLLHGRRLESWKRTLNPPVSILFDFGAVHEGYCYDFGRTVAFGEPDKEFQQVYDLVMKSQAAGVAALRADENSAEEADAAAREIIEQAGYGEEFRHRLGHAIGMDVHEPPFLTAGDGTPLQEGMLFTVEPSITQHNSFSARVEDVVVVRQGGGEKLTDGFQSLIVID